MSNFKSLLYCIGVTEQTQQPAFHQLSFSQILVLLVLLESFRAFFICAFRSEGISEITFILHLLSS